MNTFICGLCMADCLICIQSATCDKCLGVLLLVVGQTSCTSQCPDGNSLHAIRGQYDSLADSFGTNLCALCM